jgi:hypothetical protein
MSEHDFAPASQKFIWPWVRAELAAVTVALRVKVLPKVIVLAGAPDALTVRAAEVVVRD